jgi:hypothetical protein
MEKLKLDLADLRVDSFSTASQEQAPATVAGQTWFDSGCCTQWETNCNCLTQYQTQCCPDDSGMSWGSCGTTCLPEPVTCMNYECGVSASEYGTWCVTGCQQCNC